MLVTLVLNEPPGGRCRLYRAYAAALVQHVGAYCVESFGALPAQTEVRAPAILIDGRHVQPSDGVIVAPEDIGATIGPSHPDVERLVTVLEEVLEAKMQEWG